MTYLKTNFSCSLTNRKATSINDWHKRVVKLSPCILRKYVVLIYTVFCKPDSPTAKSKKGNQLTVLHLVKNFHFYLIPINKDPNIVFHVITKQDKSHNASTKVPYNEAIVEVDAPRCLEVKAPLCYHHMLKDIEQLLLKVYELSPYTIVYRHQSHPFVKQTCFKNKVLKIPTF